MLQLHQRLALSKPAEAPKASLCQEQTHATREPVTALEGLMAS